MIGPRLFGYRALCWFLACLMIVSPSGPLLAQRDRTVPRISDDGERHEVGVSDPVLLADPADPPVEVTLDLTYMLPDAILVISAHPGRVLSAKVFSLFPIEVLQAAAIQQTGVDPLEVEHVLISMAPPAAGPPHYSVVTRHAVPIVGKLHPHLLGHTEKASYEGREYFASQVPDPLVPSIYIPDDQAIVLTPEKTLQEFFAGSKIAKENPLAEQLIKAKGDDFYLALNVEPLRPLLNMLLMQHPVPPEMQPFLAAPDLVSKVTMRLNLAQAGTSELVVEANNSEDAKKLLAMLEQAFSQAKSQGEVEVARLKADPDPVQQALGTYQERMMQHYEQVLMPKREADQLVIFRYEGKADDTTMLTTTAITGVLVALLLPAVQAARMAARRAQSINNVKNMMLSLLIHEDRNRSLPPYAIFDDEEKPLLSWRVRMLPYLEEQQLYEQFRLDEPWDSEHNKALIEKMPQVFLDPASSLLPTDGNTHYLGIKGEGYMFSGTEKGTRMMDVRDGTSNTIMLVQVPDEHAAVWTKPEDWEPDAKNPLKGSSTTRGILFEPQGHTALIHGQNRNTNPR